MKLRAFLILSVLACCLNLAAQGVKPNILFIAVDDLKPTLSCYGDSLAHTPNIDALAQRGVTFTKAYCQQAVCAPSRASLMTSRYPDQTRVWDLQTLMRDMNPDIVTLPQYLREKGYRTCGTGKIFDSRSVDNNRDTPSWSVSFRNAWDTRYYSPADGKPVQYFYASAHAKDTVALLEAEAAALGENIFNYVKERYHPSIEKADVAYDAYADGAIANVGIELLEECAASGQEFFLAVGFNRPHLPFNAPAEYWELWDRNDFSLAPFREQSTGGPSIAYHNADELRSYTDIPSSGSLPESKQLELIHAYYAATAYIDDMIGKLVQGLDELGLRENTLIVLWGDHGWHLGDHDLWCKHTNFEEATRVPMIVVAPGMTYPGASSAGPVEFTDLAPTLLDLAGLPIPGYFEGLSLLPMLEDTLAVVREAALSQYPRQGKMGYSLRTGRYRYTRWQNEDGSAYARELYDYETDPLETTNLVFESGLQDQVNRLDSMVLSRIEVPSTQHKIQLRVYDSASKENLGGIEVSMAGEKQYSNASDTLLFTHHSGPAAFSLEAGDYLRVDTTFTITSDTLLEIPMHLLEPVYVLDLSVRDRYNGKKLINALLTLDAEEARSDTEGSVQFEATAGRHMLRIEKTNYATIEEELLIEGETSRTFSMEALLASIKIRLEEGNSPVNNARVRLEDMEELSSSLGTVTFSTLPTAVQYNYLVEKEGYQSQEGQIYLLADTTVDVQFSKITALNKVDEHTDIEAQVLKNNLLQIAVPQSWGKIHLSLVDASGKIFLARNLTEGNHRIDLSVYPPGLYLLSYGNNRQRHFRKITIN